MVACGLTGMPHRHIAASDCSFRACWPGEPRRRPPCPKQHEQEAGSSVLFEHCSAGRTLAVEAVDEYREQIGLCVRSLGCMGHWRLLVKGMASTHSLKPPAPQRVVVPGC